jgi:hypothetical protein
MPTSTSTHVSSLLALVVSVVAVFHPGFVISPDLQGKIVTIGLVAAALFQLAHVGMKALALKLLHDFQVRQPVPVSTPVPTTTSPSVSAPVSVMVSQSPETIPHAEGSNNVANAV